MRSIIRITVIAALLISATAFSQAPKDLNGRLLYWHSPSTNSFMIVEDSEMKHQYSLNENSWKSEKLTVSMYAGDKLSYYTPVGTAEHDYLMYDLCGNVGILENNIVDVRSFAFGSKNFSNPTIFSCNGDIYFYGNMGTSKTETMMYSKSAEKWSEEPIKNENVPLLSFARSIDAGKQTYLYGGDMYNKEQNSVFKFDGENKELTKLINIKEKDCESYNGGIIRFKSKYYIFNTSDEQFYLLKNKIDNNTYDFIVDSKHTKLLIIFKEKGTDRFNFSIEDLAIGSETLNFDEETGEAAANSKPNQLYLYLFIGGGVLAFFLLFLLLRKRKK